MADDDIRVPPHIRYGSGVNFGIGPMVTIQHPPVPRMRQLDFHDELAVEYDGVGDSSVVGGDLSVLRRIGQRLAREVRLRRLAFPVESVRLQIICHQLICRVTASVVDRDGGERINVRLEHALLTTSMFGARNHPASDDLYDFALKGIRETVKLAIEHEVDECLVVAGVRRFDPHA